MVAIPSLGCNVTYTILLEHTWYNIGKVRIRITYYSKQTVFIKLLVRQTFSYYVSSHYVDKNKETFIYMIFLICISVECWRVLNWQILPKCTVVGIVQISNMLEINTSKV